ncbi:receptor kinase-like protein Xa21 [Rutidosis leptorrhynchoides]|uniref:receptor kinase-like protein Xa21 n=1 Tax=Rutidosis leptorrhynchoides TaxID=125765 RepID=UPI003A999977
MNSKKPLSCLVHFSNIITFLFSGFIIVFLVTATTISASYDGNETDHMALLSFKKMITRDPYGVLNSWNTSFHFCDWSGVSCGKRHRRVTALQLISQGLEGSLSPHVGNLSFLRQFVLVNNSFQGTIPQDLGRLSRLRVLVLEQNQFNGVIPTNLSGCSNLEALYLDKNQLVGSIPKDVSLLSKLTYLVLGDNNLTGGIPSFLGNITSMQGFSVTSNPLGGNIPDALGRWKSLRRFEAAACKLYGTIPRFFYNLSFLTTLSLAENQLSGNIPPDFGATLPNLLFLELWGNQLGGFLPPSISNCSKLRTLEIFENNIRGTVTIDFEKLSDISFINFSENNLHGRAEAGEMKFIDSLKNCSKLKTFFIGDCKFEGALPGSIGNLSHQFKELHLGGNMLSGNIPSEIGNLVGLSVLELSRNQFTGNIPSVIGNLQNLQYLGLFQNQLSGLIPDAIGNLSKLVILYLHTNVLEGHIPSGLGNCHQLSRLFLSDNKLSGIIPKEILQLSSLTLKLDLSHNNLSGSVPAEVGDLNMLTELDLSDNRLSGNIPSTLGGCNSLTFLSLKGNSFQGMIPSSLSSMRGLETIDLSDNNLLGEIPQFFEGFSLQYLNLSFNDFEGEVPVVGVFANASSFSVVGNSRLCGGLVELGLPKCKLTKKHNGNKFPPFVIFILIVSALISILVFVYVCCKSKRKIQVPQSSSMNGRFLKVSYGQLLKATNGFSQANLIGKGGFSSVYKGTLDQDDKLIAVKVLHLQNRGADRSFTAECEVWRSIRQRNLLKIITSCSGVDFHGNDFKALVYEFMPNGSLHDWLHTSESHTSRLNLVQRINILINIAYALDYLHNHCIPSIVHGDLKPSNILLDEDMVAHVGDFGLARFLGMDLSLNSSSVIKGTIGYAPPEYGLGNEFTSSGDIYSYGILLLEVMTGKKPTDDTFKEGFSLHKFAYMALPDHVNDIIDGELLNLHHDDYVNVRSRLSNAKIIEECVALTVKIGVSCSVDSPSQRMNIKNVVNELQHILDAIQRI